MAPSAITPPVTPFKGKTSWQDLAKSARDYRDATLSKVSPPLETFPDPLPLSSQDLPKQMLTAREYELTQNYDALALLEMLRSKKVSSEELTKAFLRRAALAQYAVNCVTELMWDEAVERAKYLDSLPEPVGPLHGLPISVCTLTFLGDRLNIRADKDR
jgi:amidase